MDVTLGVSVRGTDAQIALLDAAPPHAVIDQSEVHLSGDSIDMLVSTLVSTDRALTDSGHRLVATRVCGSGAEQATTLRDALVDADLLNVTVVSQPDAVSAVARSLTPGETVAALAADGDTAALSIVDAETDTTSLIAVEPIHEGDKGAAYRTLLQRFSEEPGGATSVVVLGGAADVADWSTVPGGTTPIPLRFPDKPEFAVARGAAMSGFRERSANEAFSQFPDADLDFADTELRPQSQQLAYSQVEGEVDAIGPDELPMQTPMRPLSAIDPDEIEEDVDGSTARPKVLLLGSTVAAVVVVGFAALAVSVAIGIRPDVTEQAVRVQQQALPGKYFPVAPGQGVEPDGENWTLVEQVPAPGVDTGVRTFETKPLSLASARTTVPSVIELYPDYTVGVQSVPNVTSTPIVNAGAGPVLPDFVPRLIPDLSKVNMCQVLSFVSNLQSISADAVQGTVVPLTEVVNPVSGLSLGDLGKVAAVPPDQGELFSARPGTEAVSGAGVIPAEIFKTGGTQLDAAQVLPPGTTVIENLPNPVQSGKSSGTTIFGDVIPAESLPERGRLPVQTDLDSKISIPQPTSPDLKSGLPEFSPGTDKTLPETVPSTGGILPGTEKVPGSGLLPPAGTVPKPEVTVPKPEVAVPKPEITVPKPEVTVPKPEVTMPEPEVVAPKPQPRFQLPEIFEKPAPSVSQPEVQVPAPKPVFELPSLPKIDLPIPLPAAPAEPVVPAAPAPTLPQLPLLPELPFGGGLFGSGQS